MKRKVKVLTICGSGVVTSSMLANKIKDMLTDEGYSVEAKEASPTELETFLLRDTFDFIAYSTPVGDTKGIPALNAIGLITGLGDDEFLEEALKILENKE